MNRTKQSFGQLIAVLLSLLLIYHFAVNYGANSNAQRNLLSKNWDSDYQKEEGIKGVYEYFRSIGKLPVDKQTTNKADAAANDPTTEWFKSQAANPSAVLITILIPKSTENETILCSDALEEDALKEIGRIAVNDKEFECDPVRIAQMLGEEWEYFGCDDDKQEWVAEGSKMHKFGRKKGMDDMKSAYKRWCDKQLCDEDVFMFKVNRQEKWFKSYTKCGELHGLGSNGLDEAQMDSLIHEMGTNGWEEKGKKNPSEYYQISKKMRSKRMLKPFKCKCAKCNRAKAVGEKMRQAIQESGDFRSIGKLPVDKQTANKADAATEGSQTAQSQSWTQATEWLKNQWKVQNANRFEVKEKWIKSYKGLKQTGEHECLDLAESGALYKVIMKGRDGLVTESKTYELDISETMEWLKKESEKEEISVLEVFIPLHGEGWILNSLKLTDGYLDKENKLEITQKTEQDKVMFSQPTVMEVIAERLGEKWKYFQRTSYVDGTDPEFHFVREERLDEVVEAFEKIDEEQNQAEQSR